MKASSLNLRWRNYGKCRFCRCTDREACPEGCTWYDIQHTVCDSPICVARFRLALAVAMKKLLKIGLDKQQLSALSCYHEAAVIVEDLRQQLAEEVDTLNDEDQ